MVHLYTDIFYFTDIQCKYYTTTFDLRNDYSEERKTRIPRGGGTQWNKNVAFMRFNSITVQ